MNTATKVAVSLDEATDLVPFSSDYLRKAVKRTEGNVLRARLAGRKYVVTVENLTKWVEQEGEDA